MRSENFSNGVNSSEEFGEMTVLIRFNSFGSVESFFYSSSSSSTSTPTPVSISMFLSKPESKYRIRNCNYQKRSPTVVKVTSEIPDAVEFESESEYSDSDVLFDNEIALEPKLQKKLEQKMKMKVKFQKKIRLRRMKLVRLRRMRKRRSPPSKLKKIGNV